MAERLPRYRQVGLMPTSIGALPSVDVLSGGLEAARGYEKISEALSRVSAFAFEKLGERRQREGEQFRLENPITAEQVEAALSEGRSIDEIVGDPDTVFGRASRSTAVMQLETELEGQARSVIAELTGRLDGGEPIDTEYIQQTVRAMTEGHADLLANGCGPGLDRGKSSSGAFNVGFALNRIAETVYEGQSNGRSPSSRIRAVASGSRGNC